ncbi:tRNA (adenosine(37)-N6)-dimethylallyltransferase MiaA [Hyphobacterium sp.]|uniref:tRNA (adenosine(37)-N6)-dimethylallyltransferase MiaA n=1 Tax=Hyphobacterium sp. TaxID=2004662 RepID=UPI0037487CF9
MIANTDPVILLAGPTASGKTALSVGLARSLNGEIINADSMQVYRDLRILSARPDEGEQGGIPHHLFGVLDASERASVGWWADAAMDCIDNIRSRGKRPILVGGTGLYFSALVKGLAAMPEISARTRQSVEDIAAQGLEALREQAMACDPAATARIKPADRQRMMRVVEIGLETGKAISDYQADTHPLLAPDDWIGLVIEPERAALYARIEQRFDRMLDEGALGEVAALAERGLDPVLPAMKALGVPPLLAVHAGQLDLAEAVHQAKQDSRRYAKRQLTWLRNQMPDWQRLPCPDGKVSLADVISQLDRSVG